MESLTLGLIAKAVNGSLESAYADVVVTAVTTDTRAIVTDGLFIALQGEHFDGHTFVAHALQGGAAAVMISRDHIEPVAGPCIIVDDTLVGLQQFAAWFRKQFALKIVGITGSNGKTTTKEMLAAILATKYSVHKTAGNLNNHIGVPLTLLGLERGHTVAVVEMGMSNLGEIELLTQLTCPDVGVVTGIAPAHLETLKTLENIATAKLELPRMLDKNATVILNGDIPLLTSAITSFSCMTVRFGYNTENEMRVTEVMRNNKGGYSFMLSSGIQVVLRIPGVHNVMNALAAISAAYELGITPQESAQVLARFRMSGMRLEAIDIHGVAFLNDTYNANPASVAAALDELGSAPCSGRRIAVLGDMLELGEQSSAMHYDIGQQIATAGIDYVFAIGVESSFYIKGARVGGVDDTQAVHYETMQQLMECLGVLIRPGDLVLVKGSRGMQMEQVLTYLEHAEG